MQNGSDGWSFVGNLVKNRSPPFSQPPTHIALFFKVFSPIRYLIKIPLSCLVKLFIYKVVDPKKIKGNMFIISFVLSIPA